MTIATGEPAGSTTTTEPTRLSRICRATETALASGGAVTTPAVMISRSFTPRTLPGVDRTKRTPVVPLEAGAGPDNPPCPACGEPLFGWIDRRPGLAGPVSRCESCGLGVVGADASTEEALHELDRCGDGSGRTIVNRAGFAAWIGGAGWAGLEPGARYLFTPESVRRLVANRDQIVASTRWSPAKGVATMWQTILNSATFGHNGSWSANRSGRPKAAWQRRIDWLVVVACWRFPPRHRRWLPLELAGALFRRGSASSRCASSCSRRGLRGPRARASRPRGRARGSRRGPASPARRWSP